MNAPTFRERFRPLELVIGAAVLGVFTGVVVVAVTRQLPLASVFAGIAFISALLVLAMLALAEGKPQAGEDGRPLLQRHDAEDQAPGADGQQPPER